MIKYWVQLENNGDTLLKGSTICLKCLHENGKESCYSCVVKVLELLDLKPFNLLRKNKYLIKKMVIGKLRVIF